MDNMIPDIEMNKSLKKAIDKRDQKLVEWAWHKMAEELAKHIDRNGHLDPQIGLELKEYGEGKRK